MLTTRDAARLRLAHAMAEQAERVGARLLEARAELGLTRPQMAERFKETSVTDDYIYRWENGKVMPSEAYQAEIIEHYELDGLADMMGGPKASREESETPDLLGVSGGGPSQLDRIEQKVDALCNWAAEANRREAVVALQAKLTEIAQRSATQVGDTQEGRNGQSGSGH